MTHNNLDYQEHQLKRWMRPDAHRFVRPDWRRFVRPASSAITRSRFMSANTARTNRACRRVIQRAGSGRARVAVLVAMIHASSPMQRQTP
jgi:hypothetical protein